jgi:hypothetical protein
MMKKYPANRLVYTNENAQTNSTVPHIISVSAMGFFCLRQSLVSAKPNRFPKD